jgi:DNA mismatch endonuclease, patch repair protein
MTDSLSAPQRSAHMARIRAADTRPELIVRRWLHAAGYRFRLHARSLPGRPDIALRRYKTVILVHGCFWHRHCGCRLAYRPKSHRAFWEYKFSTNMVRDRRRVQELLNDGWRVIIVWECGLRGVARTASTLERLSDVLVSVNRNYLEIPAAPSGVLRSLPDERTKPRKGTENGKYSAL